MREGLRTRSRPRTLSGDPTPCRRAPSASSHAAEVVPRRARKSAPTVARCARGSGGSFASRSALRLARRGRALPASSFADLRVDLVEIRLPAMAIVLARSLEVVLRAAATFLAVHVRLRGRRLARSAVLLLDALPCAAFCSFCCSVTPGLSHAATDISAATTARVPAYRIMVCSSGTSSSAAGMPGPWHEIGRKRPSSRPVVPQTRQLCTFATPWRRQDPLTSWQPARRTCACDRRLRRCATASRKLLELPLKPGQAPRRSCPSRARRELRACLLAR